ncbi:16435_t:CDS:1, partial [Racocetra persica]
FGMLMWEVATGKPPFYNRAHDGTLLIDVLKGERPPHPKVPEFYTDLIRQCWDPDPNNRPCAEEIQNTVKNWYYEKSQCSKFSDFLDTQEPNFTTHPNAVYTSRSL